MTRKDYIMIANVLRKYKPHPEDVEAYARWDQMVEFFSLELSNTNARFDAIRFKEACIS